MFQDTWLRVVNPRAHWLPQGASFRTGLYTLACPRVIDVPQGVTDRLKKALDEAAP